MKDHETAVRLMIVIAACQVILNNDDLLADMNYFRKRMGTLKKSLKEFEKLVDDWLVQDSESADEMLNLSEAVENWIYLGCHLESKHIAGFTNDLAALLAKYHVKKEVINKVLAK